MATHPLWVFLHLGWLLQVLMLIFLGNTAAGILLFLLCNRRCQYFSCIFRCSFFRCGRSLIFVQLISWVLVSPHGASTFINHPLDTILSGTIMKTNGFTYRIQAKVLFCWTLPAGARRRSNFAYMPASNTFRRLSALPAAAYVCGFTRKRQFNERISVGIGTYSCVSWFQPNDLHTNALRR